HAAARRRRPRARHAPARGRLRADHRAPQAPPPLDDLRVSDFSTLTYEVDDRVARVTLNRPERGNGITLEMPRELSAAVERADLARIGCPPARVWGVPTTALWAHRIGPERAKRLLFTGDLITGREAHEWGLAIEAPAAGELDARFEALVKRIGLMPVNQLVMMKLLVNQTLYAQGLHATQVLGTVFDGAARHTAEGYAFQRRAAEAGFKAAVRERDQPFDS